MPISGALLVACLPLMRKGMGATRGSVTPGLQAHLRGERCARAAQREVRDAADKKRETRRVVPARLSRWKI
jgi:hypothetical protein